MVRREAAEDKDDFEKISKSMVEDYDRGEKLDLDIRNIESLMGRQKISAPS